MIFAAYNNFRRTNLEILDALSSKLIRSIEQCPIRALANIMNYCANLNYINQLLFTSIEKELIRRLKKTAEFEKILKKQVSDEFKNSIDMENEFTSQPNEPNEQELANKKNRQELKLQETSNSTTDIGEIKPSKVGF